MTQSTNFVCDNCGGARCGIMVMTGNNRPAVECTQCGYLKVETPQQITPTIQDRMTVGLFTQLEKFKTEIGHHRAKMLHDLYIPPPVFKPGDIVTCIETYQKQVFAGYSYQVTWYNHDTMTVDVRNLRTGEAIKTPISATRFKTADHATLARISDIAAQKNWVWYQEGRKPPKPKALPKPAPVKPTWSKPLITSAAYWQHYCTKVFKSKNPGPGPKPAPKPAFKSRFAPTNPFNIKPWSPDNVPK